MPVLVELRVLDGPNLYFPRPAIKLTLDLEAYASLPPGEFAAAARALGARIGRDIDILRCLPADQIAHTTASEVGDVSNRAQPLNESARGYFHRR